MVRVSSGKDSKQDYGTPQYLFGHFDSMYHYTLDAAASHANAKCDRYFTEKVNGLQQSWASEMVWVNPPYNNVLPWIVKAAYEVARDCAGVSLLLNNDCGVGWYKYLWRLPMESDWNFISHRVRFVGAKHSQSVSSMLVHLYPMSGEKNFSLVDIQRPSKVSYK